MNPRKNNTFLRIAPLSLAAVVVVSFAGISKSHAASATWNGTTDAAWATATNWSASPVPGAALGQTATFNNQGGADDTINLGTGVTIKSILFDTVNVAPYTIGAGAVGSQNLTLETSGTISMNSASVSNQVINANLNLGITGTTESVTVTNNKAANSNSITLAGAVSTTQAGTKILAVAGTGATIVSGAVSNGTGILTLTKAGAGLLTLSGNNSYTGPTAISAGSVQAGTNTALGTGNITLGSPTALATGQLRLDNGVNLSNALEIGAIGVTQQSQLFVPTGNASYSGTIKIVGNPNAGGTFGAATGILTILGDNTITANPTTQVGTVAPIIPQIRNGIVRYAGAQSYINGTGCNGGTIQFGKITSSPAVGTVTAGNTSGVAINVGGPGEFTIASTATAGSFGGLLAGISGQGASVAITSGGIVGIDTTNAVGTQTFTAPFGNNGVLVTSATPTLGFVKLGTGTLEFTGGGTYNGVGSLGAALLVREGMMVLNGGTHTVTGEAAVGGVFARTAGGPGTNARLQIDAGTLTVSGPLSVGKGNGIGGVSSDLVLNNAAVVNANGGYSASYDQGNGNNHPTGTTTLNNTSSLIVGGNNEFNLAQSGGTLHTLTLNDASTVTSAGTGTKLIGNAGTGILNINGTSTITFGNREVYLGYRIGNGTVNQAGGTFTTAGEVRVGGSDIVAADIATGTYNLTGGTANFASLVVARGQDATSLVTGTVNISAGVLNSTNDVLLGFNGADNLGKLVLSGTGTLNVGSTTAKTLQVGVSGTSKGQLDVGGGALNLRNNSSLRMNSLNTTGANVINQTGGAITFFSNAGTTVGGSGVLDLQTQGDAASSNTYNLNGGTLTVPQIVSTGTSGTRIFNFNGGTLKAATPDLTLLDLGTGSGSAHANVRNGGAIVDTNGLATTIAQALEHSNVPGDNATDGGLLKQGLGTLTLSGSNTYNGATTVSAGTLSLGGTLTSNITVGNLATITGSGSTTGSLTLEGGSVLSASIDSPLQANGVTFSGPVKLSFNGTPTSGHQYVLVKYGAGGVTGLANLTTTFRSTITNDPANSRVLGNVVTASLNWNTTNGTWATNTGGWLSGPITSYFDGDDVTFGQRPAASTVTIGGPVSPASVLVTNTTSPYTFTGAGSINGPTSLTKEGSGVLSIATANTYSGGTILSAGTLNINNPTALGTGTLTINGGVLDNTSGAAVVLTNDILQNWNTNITFTGTNNLDLGKGVVTAGSADPDLTVTVNAGILAIGKLNVFSQGLVKQGAGKLEVGSNAIGANGSLVAGVLNVAAGELQINRTAAPAATAGDFNAAGITGSGTITNGAAVARWIYSNLQTGNSQTFSGTLANGGTAGLGINVNGQGTQILSGTNTYTDTTTVSGGGELVISGANTGTGTNVELQNGRLTVNHAQALGTNSFINLTGNANLAVLNLATDTDAGANLYSFKASSGNVGTIISNRATPGAGINHTLTTLNNNGMGGATLHFLSGSNVTSGSGRITFAQFALAAGTVQTTHLDPTTASVTLGNVSKQTNNASQTLDLAGTSQDNLVTGVISNGPALLGANNVSLIKSGDSTWTLSGNSTYTGTTAVNEGTLVITGNNSAATGALSVAAGATLAGNGNLGGNVTISTGGTHALTVAATSGAQVTRAITGTLTHDFGDVLSLTASTQPANGTYTLVTATGGINALPSTVTYSGIAGASVSIVGNSLVMTIGAASDFSTWINGFTFAPGADTTATGDPDRDGLTNLQEYAFGLIPNSGSSVNPYVSQLNKTTGQFTYTRRKPSLTGLNYIYQYTTDLVTWNPFTPTTTVSNNGDPVEAVTVTAPASVTNNAKAFIRVKAN